MLAEASQVLNWAQFGALGVTCATLFGLLRWVLSTSTAAMDNERKECSKERSQLHAMHASERTEWRQQSEKQSERMESVIKDLASAIREKKV